MDKAYLSCNEYYTLKDFDNKIKFLSYHSFNTSESDSICIIQIIIIAIVILFHNILIWTLEQFLLIIEDKGDNNYNYTIHYERNLILSAQLEYFSCEITDFHKIILIIHQSSFHEWKLIHVTSKCVYRCLVLSRTHDNWLLFSWVYVTLI